MMLYKIVSICTIIFSVSLLGSMKKPTPGPRSMQQASAALGAAQHKTDSDAGHHVAITVREEDFSDLGQIPHLGVSSYQTSESLLAGDHTTDSATSTNKILVLHIKQALEGASCSDDRLEESIAELQHKNRNAYQQLVSHFSAQPVTRGRKGSRPQASAAQGAHGDAIQLMMHKLVLAATTREKDAHSKRANDHAKAAVRNKWFGICGTSLAGIVTLIVSHYFKQQC